mmetsp:Transcript_1562/g.2236  ORF Transcript_1562/g.2236 Transcript_1562/m.2236 type:complete len:161 (-) Transcript_1562:163-645(-)
MAYQRSRAVLDTAHILLGFDREEGFYDPKYVLAALSDIFLLFQRGIRDLENWNMPKGLNLTDTATDKPTDGKRMPKWLTDRFLPQLQVGHEKLSADEVKSRFYRSMKKCEFLLSWTKEFHYLLERLISEVLQIHEDVKRKDEELWSMVQNHTKQEKIRTS